MKPADLTELNKREPEPVLIARLMTEACGKPIDVSLADMLEFRRDQYGLTASRFAMVLGLTASHYSEIVNGKRDMPIRAAKRAYALGIPADMLLAPSPLRGEI